MSGRCHIQCRLAMKGRELLIIRQERVGSVLSCRLDNPSVRQALEQEAWRKPVPVLLNTILILLVPCLKQNVACCSC